MIEVRVRPEDEGGDGALLGHFDGAGIRDAKAVLEQYEFYDGSGRDARVPDKIAIQVVRSEARVFVEFIVSPPSDA